MCPLSCVSLLCLCLRVGAAIVAAAPKPTPPPLTQQLQFAPVTNASSTLVSGAQGGGGGVPESWGVMESVSTGETPELLLLRDPRWSENLSDVSTLDRYYCQFR